MTAYIVAKGPDGPHPHIFPMAKMVFPSISCLCFVKIFLPPYNVPVLSRTLSIAVVNDFNDYV